MRRGTEGRPRGRQRLVGAVAVMTALVGGLIGVFFIIALRKPLCVDANLPWPESVASAEIVKAGTESGDAPRTIFGSMGFAALMQVFKSDKGLQFFREFSPGNASSLLI